MLQRRIGAAIGGLLLALVLALPARAHANLLRSEPAAGATLAAAPQALVLEFSEELDPGFSKVELLDSKGQVLVPGPGSVDTQQPTVLRLALDQLPNGSYTAIWRARSAVDGHVTEGNLPFGIGEAAPVASLIPPPGTPDPATLQPPLFETLARWLSLATAAIALGGLPFGLLVWRPAFRRWSSGNPDSARNSQRQSVDQAMTRFLRRLIWLGCALFVLANLLFLLAQAATAAGVAPLQALGAPLAQLLAGRSGIIWIARVLLIGAVALLAWRLPPAGRGAAWPWLLGMLLLDAVLLTFSLNSHGAALAEGAALAVLLDWLHLFAMVAWLGGLIPLMAALRAARQNPKDALPMQLFIPQFTRLAAPCVLALTATGIYAYWLQVGSLDLLQSTTYGRALLVKLGLFVLLLLLGGLNLFIFEPRIHQTGNRLLAAFLRSVPAELLIGALVLLAVGAMTSVAPSQAAWQQHEQLGLEQRAQVDQVGLVLHVAPATIGDNEFAVDVTDARPNAQGAPSKVLLRFNMQGMEMGALQTDAQPQEGQRYTARGSFINMGGRWNVEVVLRRAGFDDVRHTFQVDVVRSAAAR